MTKILIIEDDERLARFLQLELEHEGYETLVVHNGREGLEKALNSGAELILLDLMLPFLSGIEVCRRIRQKSDIPIIMVTAKDDVSDKVTGLDTGADDYVTKPFAIEELLARIRAALKRNSRLKKKETILKNGSLFLNDSKCEVRFNNEVIKLTRKEFKLLRFLMSNINIVVSREDIISKVWGFDYYGDTNVVDVYISYLRNKIDQKYNVEIIHTVRGVGYIIKKWEED